jgi:hypothetical protein
MYKSMIKYAAMTTLLLTTACGGENHCYPGYQTGEDSAYKVRREQVLFSGTPKMIAKRNGISLDYLASVNDLDALKPNQKINSGDTICLPKRRKKP